ncbi:MAG: helix-turn-helix domain-containing protein [Prevotella sp.]|jgi:AraC-like DNA-binding protein|nr:helix-turn-helix domain-containing protein [Prevotella sp.]
MIGKIEYSSFIFNDCNISDLEKNGIIPNNDSEYHTIDGDFVTFVFFEKGEGSIRIDSNEYSIVTNTLLTLLPGSIYSNIHYTEDVAFKFIRFSADDASKLSLMTGVNIYETIYNYPCIKLTDEQFNNLLEFRSFILRQCNRKNHPHREVLVKTLLPSFIIEISGVYAKRLNKNVNTDRHKELFHQFNKLLFDNIKKERAAQFYADKMFLSTKYASHIIKEVSGKSMAKWINEWAISSIKIMLKTMDITVAQISEELNYPNPSYMGRYFKKHTGMTPIQYRNNE